MRAVHVIESKLLSSKSSMIGRVLKVGMSAGSFGSEPSMISVSSLKLSPSVSSSFGSVPVSVADTKMPVLVSCPSKRLSPSESGSRGSVPASNSSPSSKKSSSVSGSRGSEPEDCSSKLTELSISGSPSSPLSPVASKGSRLLSISQILRRVSSSLSSPISDTKGSVPVSVVDTNIPVLVSCPSRRVSSSLSGSRGSVPVVLTSTKSLASSSSESGS